MFYIGRFLFFCIVGFLIIISLFFFPFWIKGARKTSLGEPNKKLDICGVITNVILSIVYIPLSLVGCLMGMVSEGYMYGSTALQSFLCDAITILGIFTPLVSICGIITSVLHRKQGRSGLSFFIQFSGLIYFALVIGLAMVLEFT